MIAGGRPLLADPEQYAQALGVLKREELSPRDLWLFSWLVNVTAAAFLLSALWVVIVLVGFGAQRFVLFAATAFHLAVVWFVLMNAPLFWKLFAASRRERALQLTRPLRAIAALEPGAWSRRLGQAVLIAIAVVAFYSGIVGFSVWAKTNWIGKLAAICSVSTGFSCALIYLVDRARRRRRALSRLQAAIDDAKDGAIDPVYYDAIVCLERAQILQDREHAVMHTTARPMSVVRMADEFREQLNGLDVADAAAATALIRTLSLAEPYGSDDQAPETCPIRPGLSLDYLRQRGGNEILLLALTATEGRHNG
jgi:hypothetical protein